MRPPQTFGESDLDNAKHLVRKLNDTATAITDTQNALSECARVKLVPFEFSTQAYINPYDAPFPLSIGIGAEAKGVAVVQIEKTAVGGKLRGTTSGVTVLWSNAQGGKLVIESITGLANFTTYKAVFAVFL